MESTTGYTLTPVCDILVSVAQAPDRRDKRLIVAHPKDTGNVG